MAELRAETGLKLPDCCVSRAAQQSGAAILTFDHRLGADARERGIELAQIAR